MATVSVKHYQMFISGEHVDAPDVDEIRNPATEELVATIARGRVEHADAAVAAARVAFESGARSRTSGSVRSRPRPIPRCRPTSSSASRSGSARRSCPGRAHIGATTKAHVSWRIRPRGGDAVVELSATVVAVGFADRVLLALGGRRWLEARFREVLDRLAEQIDEAAPAVVTTGAAA